MKNFYDKREEINNIFNNFDKNEKIGIIKFIIEQNEIDITDLFAYDLYCHECYEEINEDDIICKVCYDNEVDAHKDEVDILKDTILKMKNKILKEVQ
jgi:rRNA maturation endonuclease Nob1